MGIAETKDIINLTLTRDQIELIKQGLASIDEELCAQLNEVDNLNKFLSYKLLKALSENNEQQ